MAHESAALQDRNSPQLMLQGTNQVEQPASWQSGHIRADSPGSGAHIRFPEVSVVLRKGISSSPVEAQGSAVIAVVQQPATSMVCTCSLLTFMQYLLQLTLSAVQQS